jgi:2,3-bisphosphoglycerate-dependent phosphoglycerate mutase
MNTFYFLRHAETEKNQQVPATEWNLSERGKRQALEISEGGAFNDVDIIISPGEEKAYQTVMPIAAKINKEIVRMGEFNEMKRGEKFFSKDEFEKIKREKLEDLDCDKDGGESARVALERFENGLKRINELYDNKKILIVSHGTILALYFSKLMNKMREVYDRWCTMQFCAWGIVKDNKVERDIL